MISFKRCLALLVSLVLLSGSFTQAQAAIVANNRILQQAQLDNEESALLRNLMRDDVREQLLGMGVSVKDVENRIRLMTSDEIAQLNQQIEELPAGGDALGLIVLIFIIFVITDVIGATDIFPFIHPVR